MSFDWFPSTTQNVLGQIVPAKYDKDIGMVIEEPPDCNQEASDTYHFLLGNIENAAIFVCHDNDEETYKKRKRTVLYQLN